MENIAHFLAGADKLGVPKHDLFQTIDLYEKKNMTQVRVQCEEKSFEWAKSEFSCIGRRHYLCGFSIRLQGWYLYDSKSCSAFYDKKPRQDVNLDAPFSSLDPSLRISTM